MVDVTRGTGLHWIRLFDKQGQVAFVVKPVERPALLCQEMKDACWVSSESLGSCFSSVITVPVKFSCGTVTATRLFSHRGKAVTRKEWDVVREKKSKKEA